MSYYVADVDGRGGTYGLGLRGGYQGLGQDMPPLDLTQDPSSEIRTQTLSAGDVTSFSSWWGQFSAAWADLQTMGAELDEHRARWAAVQSGADAAGDTAGANTATTRYALIGTWQELYSQIMSTIGNYSSTWESIKDYVRSLGQWVGLSGLGIFPLLLAVSAATAIAALAWVVNRYLELRANLNYDRQLLESAEAGRISGSTAAALATARRAGAPSWFAQGADLVKWGVVGLVAALLYQGARAKP